MYSNVKGEKARKDQGKGKKFKNLGKRGRLLPSLEEWGK